MRKLVFFAAAFFLLAAPAAAQDIDYDNTEGWHVSLADGGAQSSNHRVNLTLEVERGHYVYRWMKLAGTKRDKIDIQVESDGGAVEVVKAAFPPALEKHDKTLDADVATYETGTVQIPITLKFGTAGGQNLTAKIRAQACTVGRPGGDFCKMPSRQEVKLAIQVASASAPTPRASATRVAVASPVPTATPGATATPEGTPVSTATPEASATPTQVAVVGDDDDDENASFMTLLGSERGVQQMLAGGLFWFLLFVFVGGLAVNLTPCVYPLIPITISVIGAGGNKTKSQAFAQALSYVAGMSIVNAGLGLIAGLTGARLGFIFTYPPVIFAVAALLFIFAFGMYGAFDLTLPGSVQTRLMKVSSADSVGHGMYGVFFMGLVSGIIASPCSTPVLGGLATVIVAGQVGALKGFMFMMIFSLGMGLPFIILGTFSGLITSLPKSGGWMNVVKYAMGTGLLIGAYYFLGLVVKNWQFDLALGIGLIVAAVFMGVGVALPEEAKTGPKLVKAAGYIVAIAGVFFFAAGLNGAGFGPQILPNLGSQPTESQIAWRKAEPVALAEANAAGKPIFIDFYTDECKPCKKLDKETFNHPDVLPLVESFVPAKLDLTIKPWTTDEEQEEISRLEKKYHVRGVPRVMFLSADGAVIESLTLTGFEKPDKFKKRMEKALACAAEPEPTLVCQNI